jgi:cytochrome c oxidase subunit 2
MMPQSVLDPAGPQAARIGHLSWVFLVVCALTYVVVMAFLALAVRHGRRRAHADQGGDESGLTRAVTLATAATVAILFVLLGASVVTGKAVARHPDPDALRIRVTGHQWWWQVEYQDPAADQRFETANEIHVPVGRAVVFVVSSADVIHSFWVPNLHGKIDLIPTHENTIWMRADREGVFRGQCAEFCGLQHANMALLVIAEAPAAFEAWRRRQVEDARPPGAPEEVHGQAVFTAACAVCHAIRGTPAGSRAAPDLTHLASRRTLAAGTLPNTRGHLAAWIVDPQALKPGNAMPQNPLPAADLQALLAYLGSLD